MLDFPSISRIIFRADGSAEVGLGHLVRCQALAQALHPVFETIIILRNPTPALSKQLADVGLTIRPVPVTTPLGLAEAEWLASQLTPNDILVLDGYQFTPVYQRILTAAGTALVCLDDLITPPLWADVVLNQAGGVAATAYTRVPLAHLCLGPAFALLRPPFWQSVSVSPAVATRPLRLFLNMGGADPTNQTLALIPRLQDQFPSYELVVVTGVAYPHQLALQDFARSSAGLLTLYHDLAATDLAALLSTCQVFVCPPSGVAYECCATGGAVLLHLTADNQQALFNFLVAEQLALPLTAASCLAEGDLAKLAARQLTRQRALFDGKANQRLQAVFLELAHSQQCTLRRATANDASLYFTWANDPVVRQNAINSEPITWHTHTTWFARQLQNTNSYLYILLAADGEPLGQVRVEFATSAQPGLIDYSVAPAHRGKGLGTLLLRKALQRLRHERPTLASWTVLGQVKANNLVSARVFERLRFMRQAPITLHGEMYEVFRLDFPPNS